MNDKKIVIPILRLFRDNNRFTRLPDGWVRDTLLGIEWGPSSDKIMNFKDANKYCDELGGRLPDVSEMQTLIDYSKRDLAINTQFFEDTKTDDWYWSGTVVAGDTGHAWCVYFSNGYVHSFYDKDGNNSVRPVRSSQ